MWCTSVDFVICEGRYSTACFMIACPWVYEGWFDRRAFRVQERSFVAIYLLFMSEISEIVSHHLRKETTTLRPIFEMKRSCSIEMDGLEARETCVMWRDRYGDDLICFQSPTTQVLCVFLVFCLLERVIYHFMSAL